MVVPHNPESFAVGDVDEVVRFVVESAGNPGET
jgi:hypothetical protein